MSEIFQMPINMEGIKVRWFFNTTLALVLIWAVLSGKFDALHFGVGVLGSLFIAASFCGSRRCFVISSLRFPFFCSVELET